MTSTTKRFAVLALILTATTPGFAQKPPDEHSLVKMYPGSIVQGGHASVREFDEFELNIGPIAPNRKPSKTLHLEGKVFTADYGNPANRSVLEIYRNYEQALVRAGFQTLYACNGTECGAGEECCSHHPTLRDPSYLRRFLAAKLSRPEGDLYVSLAVQSQSADNSGDTLLDVIEVKPIESVSLVDAAALSDSVTRTGHAAVYGIYFDSGKADVKPESDAALKEIAKLLQEDAKLKLYVVGHTDNQGTLEFNMDLSRRRSNAVAQVLTAKYGLAAARLAGQGVGPLSPVASNDSEDGRGKNRRVELVKQ